MRIFNQNPLQRYCKFCTYANKSTFFRKKIEFIRIVVQTCIKQTRQKCSVLSTFVFVFLRSDAGGALEIAAEMTGGGETELQGGLLDGLIRMIAHDPFRLCADIILDPFERRNPVVIGAEDLGEITRGVIQYL